MRNFLLFTLIAFSSIANAQSPWAKKEYSNWYFGERNLVTFNSNNTIDTSTFPKATNSSEKWRYGSHESCASVSDSNGNILFATNGKYVFNSNGDTMQGGNGTLMVGTENNGNRGSASQGVTIVKHPLNDTLYYVFTTDDALSSTMGFYYAVINIKANNGLGKVEQITKLKKGNNGFRTTEQCSATMHANGADVWVVTHESGTKKLLAYLITANGISNPTSPVISDVAFPVTAGSDNERSALEFSWDGTMACATTQLGGGNWMPSKALQLLKFNSATGEFIHLLDIGGNYNTGMFIDPHFIVFSPQGNRLYVSELTGGKVYRYDISDLSDSIAVINSRAAYTINSSGCIGIKLGPDGVLYVTGSEKYLHKISGDLELSPVLQKNFLKLPDSPVYSLPNVFVGKYSLPLIVKENDIAQFSVYPNPTQSNIRLNVLSKEDNMFSLFDISGKKILSISNVVDRQMIDLSRGEKGIYIGVFSQGDKQQTVKIVVR